MHTFARPLAAALLVALAVSGCSSAATTASDSATPTPALESAAPTPSAPVEAPADTSGDKAAALAAETEAAAAAQAAAEASAQAAEDAASAELVSEMGAVGSGGRIEIGAGHISVEASDGSAIETSYFDSSEALRDWIAQVYGVEPVVTRTGSSGESTPGTIYTWDGLELADPDLPAQSPDNVDFSVQATAAHVGNVTIEAAGGARIGDPVSQVAAQYPDGASSFTNDAGGAGVMFTGEVAVLPTPADGAIQPFTHSVGLIALDETAGITSIFAPQANFLH